MTLYPNYSEIKKRRPVLRRTEADDQLTFRLTKRDCDLVYSVWQYRALTAPQIAALFFPSSHLRERQVNTRCKHRLRMLYHHGYLQRDEQASKLSEGRKPLIYSLDKRGAKLLSGILGTPIDWKPNDRGISPLFLDHLLTTNNVRIAITLAANKKGWKITQWLDDKTLKRPHQKDIVTLVRLVKQQKKDDPKEMQEEKKEERVAVVPDSYFIIEVGDFAYPHFLEIDRGTETGQASEWGIHDWARKIKAYIKYYESGSYTTRYKHKSLRILTVTTGERRLAHLRNITYKVGGQAQFWFTTFKLATTQDILNDPIWQMSGQDGTHQLIW